MHPVRFAADRQHSSSVGILLDSNRCWSPFLDSPPWALSTSVALTTGSFASIGAGVGSGEGSDDSVGTPALTRWWTLFRLASRSRSTLSRRASRSRTSKLSFRYLDAALTAELDLFYSTVQQLFARGNLGGVRIRVRKRDAA